MSKNNQNNEAQVNNSTNTTEVSKNKETKVPNEFKEVIGETLIINKVQKRVHRIAEEYINQIFNNMCNTFGRNNIELFKVTDKNLGELSVILKTYENTIIKK